jgi:small-conductance mechanosensitive channel
MSPQLLIDTLTEIVTDIVNFIPRLIYGLIIMTIGYLVAALVRWLVGAILRRLHFDPLVERVGVTGTLRDLGVKVPLSRLIAQAIFALLLLAFLITATRLMGLEAVARVLEQLLTFLPALLAAGIVFLLGGMVARFAGDLVGNLAAGAGISYGRRLGRLVQYVISLMVVVLALGVLGIDTSILVTAITIMIAAFGLALALALGLGSRTLVHHILAGYYMRQRFAVGQPIAFDQARGQVSSIGSVNTVVSTGEDEVVIPNAVLLESIVRAPRPASDAPPPAPPS